MSLAKLALIVDGQTMQEFDLDAEQIVAAHTALLRVLELTIYHNEAVGLAWLSTLLGSIRKVWSRNT